eukprot:3938380-Rhodomonas_salina.3
MGSGRGASKRRFRVSKSACACSHRVPLYVRLGYWVLVPYMSDWVLHLTRDRPHTFSIHAAHITHHALSLISQPHPPRILSLTHTNTPTSQTHTPSPNTTLRTEHARCSSIPRTRGESGSTISSVPSSATAALAYTCRRQNASASCCQRLQQLSSRATACINGSAASILAALDPRKDASTHHRTASVNGSTARVNGTLEKSEARVGRMAPHTHSQPQCYLYIRQHYTRKVQNYTHKQQHCIHKQHYCTPAPINSSIASIKSGNGTLEK